MVRYASDLSVVGRTTVPIAVDPPDEWQEQVAGVDGRRATRSNTAARKPSNITQLAENLSLAGSLAQQKRLVLFDAEGTLLDEMLQPDEWKSIDMDSPPPPTQFHVAIVESHALSESGVASSPAH